MSSECEICKCTAVVVRQVNTISFYSTMSYFDCYWAKIIHSNKGGWREVWCYSLLWQVDSLDSPGWEWDRLQNAHSEWIFLARELAAGIQFCCLNLASIWFLPQCPRCSCMCFITSLEMWWCFGRITGCFLFSGMAIWLNLPPVRSSSSCRKGSSFRMWLLELLWASVLKLSGILYSVGVP